MFKKLSTFIDSKLVREMGNDVTLTGLRGFHECLMLTTTVVSVGCNISPDTQHAVGEEWDKYALSDDPGITGNKRRIAQLVDPSSAEGGWLRDAIQQSSRIETVIKFSPFAENHFLWVMYTYRKSEKEPFFSVSFDVSFEGRISTVAMSGPRGQGQYVDRV